jgi:hypothetical protein
LFPLRKDEEVRLALPLVAIRLTTSPLLVLGVTFALAVPWLLFGLLGPLVLASGLHFFKSLELSYFVGAGWEWVLPKTQGCVRD